MYPSLWHWPLDCWTCEEANGNLWANEIHFGHEGTTPGNEHAFRVACWSLHQLQRVSENPRIAFRLVTPMLLIGVIPTMQQAQAIRAWVNASHDKELEDCRRLDEMYTITRQGWR